MVVRSFSSTALLLALSAGAVLLGACAGSVQQAVTPASAPGAQGVSGLTSTAGAVLATPLTLTSPGAPSSEVVATEDLLAPLDPAPPLPAGCAEGAVEGEECDPSAVDDEPPSDAGDGEEDEDSPTASEDGGRGDAHLSLEEIRRLFRDEPAALGPASFGRPNAGGLYNGVRMPDGKGWLVRDPAIAYGTQETVDALVRCLERVEELHPDRPALVIGHVSAKNGGYLWPHKSHQGGRDVDLGYYTLPRGGFDVERNFTLTKVLAADESVEMIFMDRALQQRLAQYGERLHEDPEMLDRLFGVRGRGGAPLIRHLRGHYDHLHVRFTNPRSLWLGQKLVALGLIKPPQPRVTARDRRGRELPDAGDTAYVSHRARSGDTIGSLSRHYGTSPDAIRAANRLRGDALRAGQTYRIPVRRAPLAGRPSASSKRSASRGSTLRPRQN